MLGGINATALAKFMQQDGINYKMALISDKGRFILPQTYFGVTHGHTASLKLESGTISAQVEPWSKLDPNQSVTKFSPEDNKLQLSNGKEYSYKALVLATGFDHKSDYIKGLTDFETD